MGKKISTNDLKKISKPKNNKLKLIIIIISIIAVLAAIIGFVYIANNNKADEPDTTEYVSINDTSLTQTEYVFYYTLVVNNYISTYSDYLEYIGLDTSQDFSVQYYDEDEGVTWQDFFLDMTNSLIQTSMSLYNEAKANNYTVKNDNFYDTFIDGLKTVAEDQDYTYEQYLRHIFIDTMTPYVLEKQLNIYSIALNYSEYLKENFTDEVTEEEIQLLYEESPNYFDSITYRAFSIPYSSTATEDDEANDILTYDTAYARAKAVAEATSEEEFEQLAIDNAIASIKSQYEVKDSTLVTVSSISNLFYNFQDWMYDVNRQYGNTTIIADDSQTVFYVVFYVDRKLNNENSVNFRHILLTADTYPDEDNLEVAAKALYQQWKNDGASEAKFIEYANTYSEDTVTNGLYNNSMNGDLIEDIDSWLFADGRAYGDHTIIETNVGYHILFYIGEDEPIWKANARNSLGDNKYDEYVNSIIADNILKFANGTEYNAIEAHSHTDETDTDETIESNELIEEIDVE